MWLTGCLEAWSFTFVNLYNFFHLLTCSFKQLWCREGSEHHLFSKAHYSFFLKFLFSLAFCGKFTLALIESLTYSSSLPCNLFLFYYCCSILLFYFCWGNLMTCMHPARTLFVAWLYNIWKYACAYWLYSSLPSGAFNHQYWVFRIIFSGEFFLMTHQWPPC